MSSNITTMVKNVEFGKINGKNLKDVLTLADWTPSTLREDSFGPIIVS